MATENNLYQGGAEKYKGTTEPNPLNPQFPDNPDGILTETVAREIADPEMYQKDIDERITKIRPMATPVDQISRFATLQQASSFEVKYYSVGTRPVMTTLTTAVTASHTATSVPLEVADPDMFTLDDTIRVVGVKAITDFRGTAYSSNDPTTPDLCLCVCGKTSQGQPIVFAVNGNVEEVERILNTIGNHDIDDTGDGSYTHSGVDGYNTYLKPFINNWDVTQPDNAEAGGKCYYSKDYVAKGIRLVVLDTIVAYSSGSAQQTWFRQVLVDARTQGLAVVVACHWLKGNRLAIPNHFAPWREAWADFEGQGSAGSAVVCTDVQAFINDGGEFICYLVGHSHADHIGTMKNHPQQLCIAVGAANGLPPSNIYHVNHGGEVRRQGTRSQDNFNIIGINTSSHTITLVKIGIDSTIYAQHKDFIRINYLSMLMEE